MNALGWKFIHSETFLSATEGYLTSLESRLSSCASESEAEQILGEKKALEDFVAAALNLQRGVAEPGQLAIVLDGDGSPIPNYHVLVVEKWRGYYRLDPVAKVGIGILALHESHKLQDTLKKALEEAFKKP